jgi:hypothetical protein
MVDDAGIIRFGGAASVTSASSGKTKTTHPLRLPASGERCS